MAISPGSELALLLLGGFRAMVDDVTVELARQGHPGVRPIHEFALRAIDDGADTASQLGRRQGVSKQAAAATITALERFGYVVRDDDPQDARRKRLHVTARGHEMMTLGGSLLDEVRTRWEKQIGERGLKALEDQLAVLAQRKPLRMDDLAGSGPDLDS